MRYKQTGHSAHTQKRQYLQEVGDKETLYRVLLVEDDFDDSFFAQQALKKVPSVGEIKVFPNGKELLKFLNAEKHRDRLFLEHIPTVVLLDVNMPLMDGFETLRKLRINYFFQDIKVAVLTGYKAKWNRQKVTSYDADIAFSKPLEPEKLETFLSGQPKAEDQGWLGFWRTTTEKISALI
ncbi:MAG: response regulator [Alphaproteobacteria bacterium]|nr:response regulator [Alphaproteobacteria bacterium]